MDPLEIARKLEISKLDDLLIEKVTGEKGTRLYINYELINGIGQAIKRKLRDVSDEESVRQRNELYEKLCRNVVDFNKQFPWKRC